MILENMTVPCSRTPPINKTILGFLVRLYSLLKYLIMNSIKISPSIAWPLGHPYSVQQVHSSMSTSPISIQQGLACWMSDFIKPWKTDRKINQIRNTSISNLRCDSKQNAMTQPAQTMGLNRLEATFMTKMKAPEPSIVLACISGTTLRLYLYIYQLYQVLTTKAAMVRAVVTVRMTILKIFRAAIVGLLGAIILLLSRVCWGYSIEKYQSGSLGIQVGW